MGAIKQSNPQEGVLNAGSGSDTLLFSLLGSPAGHYPLLEMRAGSDQILKSSIQYLNPNFKGEPQK